jgi:ABC-2 type transport system permease protein
MRNTYLIAKREYLERIRTRAFMVMTVLIPLLMGGSLVLPALFIGQRAQGTKRMVVVASDQRSGEVIANELTAAKNDVLKQRESITHQGGPPKRGLPPSHVEIEVDTNSSEAHRAALAAKVDKKQLDGVIWAQMTRWLTSTSFSSRATFPALRKILRSSKAYPKPCSATS